MSRISRNQYAQLYGPTTGDKIRLGNTDLYVEIERDLRVHGDELMYGAGKTLRDGMGSDNQLTQEAGCLDLVITNATILDPFLGVIKADIGIRNGNIVGVGQSGNPAIMDNITPNLVTGTSTDVISGEHMIVTAAGIDTHVHYSCPQIIWTALSNGVTTLFGGGIGPLEGSKGVSSTNGPWNLEMMFRSIENLPMNFGFYGKGNCSGQAPIVEQLRAGAAGLKVHEDFGATPSTIKSSLLAAEEFDVSVAVHTDSLNEAGFVEDSIAAFDGRAIHSFHSEGAGGGHAPDILKVVGMPNVMPSSTTPTIPSTTNTVAELFDMIVVCHNLNPSSSADVGFADSRVRAETIVAENVLQDMGAISMMSSDAQAMGRIGETFLRTFQMADLMKRRRGKLPEDASGNDNFRVLRYLAKMTINPAITTGISHMLGSITPGKLADLIVWEPAFFGAKPKLVIKGGLVVWGNMGDPNGSIPTPEPMMYRPMFGAYGSALSKSNVTFVSQMAHDLNIKEKYGLQRIIEPVKQTRNLTKQNMIRNDYLPNIEVDPQTYAVTVDGEHATIEPAESVSLGQLYFFS